MTTIALAKHAMACRFELVLNGANASRLQAAGEEALNEVERIEAQLSLYRPTSEIAHVNARAAEEPVRVSAPVFALLKHARELSIETGGTFDITMGPLIRAWGFMDGTPRCPSADELADILGRIGSKHLELDEAKLTVRFHRPGMMIDLGAVGKGYAVEQAIEIIKEAGIESALLHGGTSTLYALGSPPDQPSWRIGIEDPEAQTEEQEEAGTPVMHRLKGAASRDPAEKAPQQTVLQLELRDQALSVSSPSGKFYRIGGKMLGHVIDPRTGKPTDAAGFAAVVLPSATETDALSTALLVLGPTGRAKLESIRPGIQLYVR